MNWYKKIILSHYSEPEQTGEGLGGTTLPAERHLGDWINEHREEVLKMKAIIKRQDWTGFSIYKQQLMDYYNAPENEQIVKGIVSAAMSGQKF